MKKFLLEWKLWALLSVMVFVAVSWWTVYGSISNDFTKFKKNDTNNVLSQENWAELMDMLGQETLTSSDIPKWMLLAFTGGCPTWWSQYSEAYGRFLMWSDVDDLWKKYPEWSPTFGKFGILSLTEENIPIHGHEFYDYLIQMDGKACRWWYDNTESSAFINGESVKLGAHKPMLKGIHGWVDGEDSGFSRLPYIKYSTSKFSKSHDYARAHQQKELDVTNPYIAVYYCYKGN